MEAIKEEKQDGTFRLRDTGIGIEAEKSLIVKMQHLSEYIRNLFCCAAY